MVMEGVMMVRTRTAVPMLLVQLGADLEGFDTDGLYERHVSACPKCHYTPVLCGAMVGNVPRFWISTTGDCFDNYPDHM